MIAEEKEIEEKMEEMQDYEQFENEEGYKLNRYEITTYVTQPSVESLIKWVDKRKIIIPDFQRDYVWPISSASKLIDSVLLNLPIPNIFLYKLYIEAEEVYYVVDGFQRIQTLKYFKENKWSQQSDIKEGQEQITQEQYHDFKIKYKTSEWHGKTYETLASEDRFNFDEYSVNLTIFEQNNPKNKNSMFEVFERINTGSDRLSEQEIRNAIYPGEFLKKIRQLAQMEEYKKIIENDTIMKKRQNHIDLFLRLLTYYYIFVHNFEVDTFKVTTSKRDTLNNACEYFNAIEENKYQNYLDDIVKSIQTIYKFSSTAMYGKKRNEKAISTKIHAVCAEALVIAVIKNNFEIKISEEEFMQFKIEFWETDQFEALFVQQTTTNKNIKARIELLLEVINNEYIN